VGHSAGHRAHRLHPLSGVEPILGLPEPLLGRQPVGDVADHQMDRRAVVVHEHQAADLDRNGRSVEPAEGVADRGGLPR
jgi:hypothetical protein